MSVFTLFINQTKCRNNSTSNVAIRNPYLRVLGYQTDIDNGANGQGIIFSEEEEEEFLRMSRMPNLYETFVNSIAPSIYGNETLKGNHLFIDGWF